MMLCFGSPSIQKKQFKSLRNGEETQQSIKKDDLPRDPPSGSPVVVRVAWSNIGLKVNAAVVSNDGVGFVAACRHDSCK